MILSLLRSKSRPSSAAIQNWKRKTESKKAGVSREETALPYYKFFTRPLAEIPAQKLAVLAGGPSPVRAVSIADRNLFLHGEGGCPAAMTHVRAPYKDGILFRSRFWIGYALVEGEYRKILPESARVPDMVPHGLFAHNIKEFTNLVSPLPELCKEFTIGNL